MSPLLNLEVCAMSAFAEFAAGDAGREWDEAIRPTTWRQHDNAQTSARRLPMPTRRSCAQLPSNSTA